MAPNFKNGYTKLFYIIGSEATKEKFLKTEKIERNAQVIGFRSELKVIDRLVEYSQSTKNSLGLKIFSGVELTIEKTGPLSAAFSSSTDSFGLKNGHCMEIDIVAIGKSAIYLVESKSSIEKVLVSIFF
jgi:hypothetical protein